MAIVSPSILGANFGDLRSDVIKVKEAGADFLHIDVMDGHFVPNISFGSCILKAINDINICFDVHLMITDPLKYANDFKNNGANYITFHYEAVSDQRETINQLKKIGVKVGISIKPGTDVNVLEPFLEMVDLVLIMSVEPGFGGQKFMSSSLLKLKWLSDRKKEKGYHYLIEVDGGINYDTAKLAVENGAEVLVAGTYIFNNNIQSAIAKLMEL